LQFVTKRAGCVAPATAMLIYCSRARNRWHQQI